MLIFHLQLCLSIGAFATSHVELVAAASLILAPILVTNSISITTGPIALFRIHRNLKYSEAESSPLVIALMFREAVMRPSIKYPSHLGKSLADPTGEQRVEGAALIGILKPTFLVLGYFLMRHRDPRNAMGPPVLSWILEEMVINSCLSINMSFRLIRGVGRGPSDP